MLHKVIKESAGFHSMFPVFTGLALTVSVVMIDLGLIIGIISFYYIVSREQYV